MIYFAFFNLACSIQVNKLKVTTMQNLIRGVRYLEILKPNTSNTHIQISQIVVRDSNGINIAKNKPVALSSGTSGNIAVDGVEKSRSHPAIIHSDDNSGDKFTLDLKNDSDVSTIEYYNRLDCCQERILGSRLQLLDSNRNLLGEYIFKDKSLKVIINAQELKIQQTNGVRYVEVLQNGNTPLQISQLVVKDTNGINIAKNKPVTSSSFYEMNFPSTVVDGEERSRPYPEMYYSDKNPGNKVTLDLKNDSDVSEVVYYNRLDCCLERSIGVKINLLDSQRNILGTYTFYTKDQKISATKFEK